MTAATTYGPYKTIAQIKRDHPLFFSKETADVAEELVRIASGDHGHMRVKNLKTGQEVFYSSTTIDARRAVINAYAQYEKKDFQTWNYEERYGMLPQEGKYGWYIGDWGCLKDGR